MDFPSLSMINKSAAFFLDVCWKLFLLSDPCTLYQIFVLFSPIIFFTSVCWNFDVNNNIHPIVDNVCFARTYDSCGLDFPSLSTKSQLRFFLTSVGNCFFYHTPLYCMYAPCVSHWSCVEGICCGHVLLAGRLLIISFVSLLALLCGICSYLDSTSHLAIFIIGEFCFLV